MLLEPYGREIHKALGPTIQDAAKRMVEAAIAFNAAAETLSECALALPGSYNGAALSWVGSLDRRGVYAAIEGCNKYILAGIE